MHYTVQQLAALSGVTSRTLRHYDNIGLLCPRRLDNQYRLYGAEEVSKLQQILFFRESGLALEDIKKMVSQPDFDTLQALESHLEALAKKRDQIDRMMQTARRTIQDLQGECTMKDTEKFEAFKKDLVETNEKKYGAEVRTRWGEEAADASRAKMMSMSAETYAQFQAVEKELHQLLAAAVPQNDPQGPLGEKIAQLHKKWLHFTWAAYSAPAHLGLADMYVADPRFTAYYEAIAPGAAQYLRDAVHSHIL